MHYISDAQNTVILCCSQQDLRIMIKMRFQVDGDISADFIRLCMCVYIVDPNL